ncbi:MAG: hypothetical protein RI925_150, partial [Pseudomonadota bacterium]
MTSTKPTSPTPALSPQPPPPQRSFSHLAQDQRRREGRATLQIGARCSFSGGL